MINERDVMKILHDSNVGPNLYVTFSTSLHANFLMDYIQGVTLTDLMVKTKALPPNVVRFLSASILANIEKMHLQSVIYRDLKPENVMITKDGDVRFVDFGFAKFIRDRAYTLCGTPAYTAPEILL
jgi:serine/threonine protein kinase